MKHILSLLVILLSSSCYHYSETVTVTCKNHKVCVSYKCNRENLERYNSYTSNGFRLHNDYTYFLLEEIEDGCNKILKIDTNQTKAYHWVFIDNEVQASYLKWIDTIDSKLIITNDKCYYLK